MHKINLNSIMSKIILMIVVISILETSMFIFMSENLVEHTINNIIRDHSSKNAELYSDFIGDFLKSRMHEIEIYANSPILKTMDWKQIKPYLKEEFMKYRDIYDNFSVADREGNYKNTLNDSINNIKDREHFKAAMRGEITVSNPVTSRTTGNRAAIITAPIRNDSGEVIGVMCGSMNLIKLSNIIKELKYNYPNSYSYITDKNGLVIAHPIKEYIMKVNLTVKSHVVTEPITTLAAQILNNRWGSVKYKFDGIESINYFHEIPNTDGWKLLIKIPLSYLHNPIRYAQNRLLFIGVLGFLIATVLGHLIAINISHPLIRLKNVFSKAATGDLTVRAEIATTDEVGEAARIFNIMMDTISRLTYCDPLTNLHNKLMFKAKINENIVIAAQEKIKVAILIFDIDKFENINNTLGHDAGDKLLKCVAGKIREHLEKDVVISRISEDKFAIMLVNFTDEKYVMHIAQELLNLIKQPWVVDKYSFYITAGIGIAFYPKDAQDGESLFRNAYSAMQKAKRTGRDIYQLYDQSMNAKLIDQLNLDSSMHYALDNNEFLIHYQPQINAETGEVIGCEALLRWKNPELGIVSPAKFIPVAEANGLIMPIGEWVLRTACRQNKLWQKTGYKPITVSVNISAVQLMQESFIDLISDILNETQLFPEYLELEITESIAAENSEFICPILNKLKGMGIRIALDDFGTGYSSLNYIKNFPINNLKIDKSFISDLGYNPKNAAIVSTILAIGHNLGIKVTAEGVETEEQYDILKKQNCDIIQGYLFSKPLPGEEFEKFLTKK